MLDAVPSGARTGDGIRARDTGDRGGVFAATGSGDWRSTALLGIIGAGYLVGWVVWLIVRRRPPPAEIPGLPV